MHLVVCHAASPSQAGQQALHSLQLPCLESLLARLKPGPTTGVDENTLNLPHEHVLAQLQGWPGRDGHLPFAAALAHADGLDVTDPDQSWGLVTPTYWELGREQIVLTDPNALGLDEAESRALWQAVRGLFDSDGWSLRLGCAAALVRAPPFAGRAAHGRAGPCHRQPDRPVAARPHGGRAAAPPAEPKCRCCCTPTRSMPRAKRAAPCR